MAIFHLTVLQTLLASLRLKSFRILYLACTRKGILRALSLLSPQIVLDGSPQLTILPVHNPYPLLMLQGALLESLLTFHLEILSRSVAETLILWVSTHLAILAHRHSFLVVLVATGCLLVRITQYLAEDARLQAADHGAVTVTCRRW